MNALIKAALDTGFIDLSFAEWLPVKGLQIKNLEKLDQIDRRAKGFVCICLLESGSSQKGGRSYSQRWVEESWTA